MNKIEKFIVSAPLWQLYPVAFAFLFILCCLGSDDLADKVISLITNK